MVLVTDQSEAEVVRIESAKVVWTDPEVEALIDAPVEILANGWVRIPETGAYYPPHEFTEVLDYDVE